jgi:hypothetical protein
LALSLLISRKVGPIDPAIDMPIKKHARSNTLWRNSMKDQMLFCVQCDEPFTYSVKEQMRHSQQGFDAPRRCQTCRQHKVRMVDSPESRADRRKVRSRRRSDYGEESAYI